MANRKETKAYYFTVEGETEELYLKWLQNEINNSPAASHLVVIKSYKKVNPIKLTKVLPIITKTDITDLCDYVPC